jgi:hypothetical protein
MCTLVGEGGEVQHFNKQATSTQCKERTTTTQSEEQTITTQEKVKWVHGVEHQQHKVRNEQQQQHKGRQGEYLVWSNNNARRWTSNNNPRQTMRSNNVGNDHQQCKANNNAKQGANNNNTRWETMQGKEQTQNTKPKNKKQSKCNTHTHTHTHTHINEWGQKASEFYTFVVSLSRGTVLNHKPNPFSFLDLENQVFSFLLKNILVPIFPSGSHMGENLKTNFHPKWK